MQLLTMAEKHREGGREQRGWGHLFGFKILLSSVFPISLYNSHILPTAALTKWRIKSVLCKGFGCVLRGAVSGVPECIHWPQLLAEEGLWRRPSIRLCFPVSPEDHRGDVLWETLHVNTCWGSDGGSGADSGRHHPTGHRCYCSPQTPWFVLCASRTAAIQRSN